MYSRKIVDANLDKFAAKEGWRPTYHSFDQIREFKAYIDSITRQDTNSRSTAITLIKELTKKRADEIRRFIENEQVLCALDFDYWQTRYAYICNEQGDIYKFIPRQGQRVYESVVDGFDELQVSIELFVLKARQLGISTVTALYFLHRMLFVPHTQAVMASVQAEKSELITRILQVCLDHLPWWLTPIKTTDKTKALGFDNGSIMSVQSGMQATGIAQGWTPTCVHISEVGDIPNPKKVLEEGLFRATHSSRKLFMVLEGTGNGNTGWQADTWRALKEDWPKGKARFCPVFIPWPMSPDIYPEADWLRKFPVPEGWQPHQETRKHVRKCELYIRNTEYLSRIVGKNWKMPINQQWFWEFNYDAAVKSHTQKVWMSQMPADDKEALVGKNDSVFTEEVIEVLGEERKVEYQAYGLIGETVDDGLEPNVSEIDYNKARIPIVWNSPKGTRYEWALVPLLPFDDSNEKNLLDKILIFEEPIAGYDYTGGIDTADGLGKEDEDRGVLSIAHSVTGENYDEQVVEFASNRINPPQMVAFAAALAAWYGQSTRDSRGVKLCIEQRMRPGDDLQLQLKLMGFTFFHRMIYYDKKRVQENVSQKEGWFTNAWSRPMMMNRFVDAIKNGWYRPHSRGLILECGDLERKIAVGGKTKLEAQAGKKDDRVLAAALSYFSRHHLDILSERQQKRYAKPSGRLPEIDYSYSRHSQVYVGDM